MDFVTHAPEKVQTVPSSRAKSEHVHQLHCIDGGEQAVVVTHLPEASSGQVLEEFNANSVQHGHIGRWLQIVQELHLQTDGFRWHLHI